MVNQDIKPAATKLNEDSATNTNQDEDGIYTESRASSRKSNKPPIIILALLAILFLAGYLIYTSPLKEAAIQLFNQITLKNLPSALPQTPKYSAQVAITSQGFIPATLLVKQGTQVTFISKDNRPHQVASDPHPTHTGLPGFIQAKPTASFTYTFSKTGTFTYHDEVSPLKFHGTVIVE